MHSRFLLYLTTNLPFKFTYSFPSLNDGVTNAIDVEVFHRSRERLRRIELGYRAVSFSAWPRTAHVTLKYT